MKRYRLTCSSFSVDVEVNDSRIIQRVSPNVAQFRGQNLDLLLRFMAKYGTVESKAIEMSMSLFE